MEFVTVTHDEIAGMIEEIAARDIPIFRKNVEGKMVTVPINKLEQYLGQAAKTIEFYTVSNWRELADKPLHAGDDFKSKTKQFLEKFGNSFEQVEKFSAMSVVAREELLDENLEKLTELKDKKKPLDIDTIIALVGVISNTFYASYANLDENINDGNLKGTLSGVIVKTEWMIKLIIEIFQSEAVTYKTFTLFNNIDTGSDTIDKMCKGILWFTAFCLFYNDYFDQGLITKKLRSEFKNKYLRYYKRRMPDTNISLETIVKGGLRRIDLEKELVTFSMGSLLYDIGKVPFITYYDGDEAYDANMVRIHTLTGYNMVLKAKSFPLPVIVMAALHHEYYGGKNSYSFTNPILSKLFKTKRDDTNANYFITFSQKDFVKGNTLAYFPCKVLEIIDISNALTAHEKMSYGEALTLMKKEFIAQSLKIDPLLYEIYIEFVFACGLLQKKERDEIDKIIF